MSCSRCCPWLPRLSKKTPKECITEYVLATDIQEDCAICLEPLTVGNRCAVISCGHIFHASCLYAWLIRNTHSPYCEGSVRL